MNSLLRRLALLTVLVVLPLGWQLTGTAQQKADQRGGESQLAKPGTRFEFEIVESFDAKYLGDTPGHIGHAGGLGTTRPHVSLGDPIYRGQEVVGKVTTATWSHVKGSLTIEFDPVPLVRIAVGEIVAVDLNPAPSPKTDK